MKHYENGKRKNGNDLPNAKTASKKKRNGKGNGKKKKKFEEVIFKAPSKKKPKWLRQKKGDALDYAVSGGHFESNRRKH